MLSSEVTPGEMPRFVFERVHFIALPTKLTDANQHWLLAELDKLTPRPSIAFVGVQPVPRIADLVRAVNNSGHSVVQFLYTGQFQWHNVTRIRECCPATHVDTWERRGSLLHWMNTELRVNHPVNVILYHNTPEGILYALKRLGFSYSEAERDIPEFRSTDRPELSFTGQLLFDALRFCVPVYSYHPAAYTQARGGVYELFAQALSRHNLRYLDEKARAARQQADDNARTLAAATVVSADWLAFTDMEPYFVAGKPVNIDLLQRTLVYLNGPVLLCSSGGGRIEMGGEQEQIRIVRLPRAWHGHIDLGQFVKGSFEGKFTPDQLQLSPIDFDRFQIFWSQHLPAIAKERPAKLPLENKSNVPRTGKRITVGGGSPWGNRKKTPKP